MVLGVEELLVLGGAGGMGCDRFFGEVIFVKFVG